MDSIFNAHTDAIERKLRAAIAGEPPPAPAPSFAYAFWQAAGLWAEAALAVDARHERKLRFDYQEYVRKELSNARTMPARYSGNWCAFCQSAIEVGQSIRYQKTPSFRVVHADVETCLRSAFFTPGANRMVQIRHALEARIQEQAHDAK